LDKEWCVKMNYYMCPMKETASKDGHLPGNRFTKALTQNVKLRNHFLS